MFKGAGTRSAPTPGLRAATPAPSLGRATASHDAQGLWLLLARVPGPAQWERPVTRGPAGVAGGLCLGSAFATRICR